MNSDVADDVIGLTNTVGSTVYDIQRATEALSSLRRAASVAARHPGGIALAGVGLLITSGVLALRKPARPGQAQQQQSQQAEAAARV